MNKLPVETRVRILSMLCEGSSMRSISRVCDVSINTVAKLLVDAGNAAADFHFEKVQGVRCRFVQWDEIWSFCYKKASNATDADSRIGRDDVWTWTAIDADSKLMISWMVGDRTGDTASLFINDLADRLGNRVQLTTDGHRPYLAAVEAAFENQIDYAMLVKLYADDFASKRGSPEKRYGSGQVIGTRVQTISGAPSAHYTSTSYAERHNLTMRMAMRRFTRLTNAFSKKIDNHCHAVSLYFFWYNWVRAHKAHKLTPAMASELATSPMELAHLVAMVDANECRAVVHRHKATVGAAE